MMESKLNVWKAEKEKWDEFIIHIIEIQEHRVNKFLIEKPNAGIDVDILFIS